MMMPLPEVVAGPRTYAQSMVGEARANSYTVTNATFEPVKDAREDADWRIADLLFLQSCQAHGSAIQFIIVTLRNGDSSVAVTWQECVVDEGLVGDIVERLRNALLDAYTCSLEASIVRTQVFGPHSS